MKVLVINCGSSSLKYQLIDMDGEKVLCKGLCESIGMDFGAGRTLEYGVDDLSNVLFLAELEEKVG